MSSNAASAASVPRDGDVCAGMNRGAADFCSMVMILMFNAFNSIKYDRNCFWSSALSRSNFSSTFWNMAVSVGMDPGPPARDPANVLILDVQYLLEL